MTAAERLVARFEAAWSAADLAQELADTCAADLHYEDPLTFKGPLHGPAALAEHVGRLRIAAPDARLEHTGSRLTDGRFVAAPVKLIATHSGELESFPATGRGVVVQAVLYCELDEAGTRLWRVRAFFDLYDAATQLGVLPKPGTLGQKAMLLMRGFGVRATP
ncbi:MAG: ester cyclase [Actinobacteria bacterium]|nr:ester cyclase [Actinomycetota bacterium]